MRKCWTSIVLSCPRGELQRKGPKGNQNRGLQEVVNLWRERTHESIALAYIFRLVDHNVIDWFEVAVLDDQMLCFVCARLLPHAYYTFRTICCFLISKERGRTEENWKTCLSCSFRFYFCFECAFDWNYVYLKLSETENVANCSIRSPISSVKQSKFNDPNEKPRRRSFVIDLPTPTRCA